MLEEKKTDPISGLIILLVFTLGGVIVSQIIAAIVIIPFIGLDDLPQAIDKVQNLSAYPEMKLPLLIAQGVSSLVMFILAPYLYLKNYKVSNNVLNQTQKVIRHNGDYTSIIGIRSPLKPLLAIMVVILTLSIFPFLTLTYEWNMTWQFPTGFHEWAVQQEESLKIMTEQLLKMNSITDLLIVLIVVAIIPGIGEELLFRGLLQTQLSFLIKNIHVVIWITAFIFSAIHMQFFGLIPRMVLGAVFGYIFYWSGSLKYSMIAHSVNNGFQVIATYVLSQSDTTYNLDEQTSFSIYISATSLIISLLILLILKKKFSEIEMENSL